MNKEEFKKEIYKIMKMAKKEYEEMKRNDESEEVISDKMDDYIVEIYGIVEEYLRKKEGIQDLEQKDCLRDNGVDICEYETEKGLYYIRFDYGYYELGNYFFPTNLIIEAGKGDWREQEEIIIDEHFLVFDE